MQYYDLAAFCVRGSIRFSDGYPRLCRWVQNAAWQRRTMIKKKMQNQNFNTFFCFCSNSIAQRNAALETLVAATLLCNEDARLVQGKRTLLFFRKRLKVRFWAPQMFICVCQYFVVFLDGHQESTFSIEVKVKISQSFSSFLHSKHSGGCGWWGVRTERCEGFVMINSSSESDFYHDYVLILRAVYDLVSPTSSVLFFSFFRLDCGWHFFFTTLFVTSTNQQINSVCMLCFVERNRWESRRWPSDLVEATWVDYGAREDRIHRGVERLAIGCPSVIGTSHRGVMFCTDPLYTIAQCLPVVCFLHNLFYLVS